MSRSLPRTTILSVCKRFMKLIVIIIIVVIIHDVKIERLTHRKKGQNSGLVRSDWTKAAAEWSPRRSLVTHAGPATILTRSIVTELVLNMVWNPSST